MKKIIYYIEQNEYFDYDYDYLAAMVIVAKDKSEARQLASEDALCEGPAIWLDSTRSKVYAIGTAFPKTKSAVIISTP